MDFDRLFSANGLVSIVALQEEFREIRRDGKVHTDIVPVVLAVLGTLLKTLAGNLSRPGVVDVIGCLQATAFLGTVRILKNGLTM